eukprot:23046_1
MNYPKYEYNPSIPVNVPLPKSLGETYQPQPQQQNQIQPQQIILQIQYNMEDLNNVIFYNPTYTKELKYMFHQEAESYPIGTSLYKARPSKYLYKKGFRFINNIKYTIKQSEFNIIRTENIIKRFFKYIW